VNRGKGSVREFGCVIANQLDNPDQKVHLKAKYSDALLFSSDIAYKKQGGMDLFRNQHFPVSHPDPKGGCNLQLRVL
jgi:hypothetical protein